MAFTAINESVSDMAKMVALLQREKQQPGRMLPEHLLRHGIGAAHFHFWVPSTRHEADHWPSGCPARSDTHIPGKM